jgi:dimethylaniline monooxygenase (N-oxide forming)
LKEKKIEILVCPTVSGREQTYEFHMPNGTKEHRDFDAVVICTGFRMEFPWLKVKDFVANPRAWFLHCFPKDLGHCLFFVGYARPHQGGIPVMAEMLSRYIALLLRGEKVLPVNYVAQSRRDEQAEREHYFVSPNVHSLVDYNAFLESVARRVGCEPRLPLFCILLFNIHMLAVLLMLLECCHLRPIAFGDWFPLQLWVATLAGFFLFDNGLLLKWWFYPHWAIWYRQRGPGAIPTLPSTVMHRVNLRKATDITRGFVLVVLWSVPNFYAQRLLSFLVFVPHTVLAAFGLRFPKAWGGLLCPKLFSLHGTEWRFSDLFLP